VEVVASLSQGRTAAAQCGLFTYKSVPVIFEPPCTFMVMSRRIRRRMRNVTGRNCREERHTIVCNFLFSKIVLFMT